MADKNMVKVKRSDYHMAYAFAFAILYAATDKEFEVLWLFAAIHVGVALYSTVKEAVYDFKKRRAVATLIKG